MLKTTRHTAKRTIETVKSPTTENPNKLNERIKKLEKLLAKQIERSAELLRESQKSEAELEKMKQQRDYWRKLYRKIRPDKKISCDRQKAMVVYGEIDTDKLFGRKVD